MVKSRSPMGHAEGPEEVTLQRTDAAIPLFPG